MNLIFFNIKESKREEVTERIEEDIKEIKQVLKKIDACADKFSKPIRLGKKCDGAKPRPVKIRLSSQEEISQILRQAKKLRGTDIFISRDMTPLERREWKELLEERNRRRKDAEEKGEEGTWIIRKGKVVNVMRGGAQQF